MRLDEFYQEEKGSNFTHDGKNYDLNKLLKLSAHIRPGLYRVSDLTWILNFDVPEPNSYDHINIEIPILITDWFDPNERVWKLVVIDGLHRLHVARVNKVSHLPGILISSDMLAKVKI